jgi:hypothetical protein
LIGRSFADALDPVEFVEQMKPPEAGLLAELVAANAGAEKMSTGATLISSAKMT